MRAATRVAAIAAGLVMIAPAVPAGAAATLPPIHMGWIVPDRDEDMCLEGGPVGTPAHIAPCSVDQNYQSWLFDSDGTLVTFGACLTSPTREDDFLLMGTCSGGRNQTWAYGRSEMRVGGSNRCLVYDPDNMSGDGDVFLRSCDGRRDQRWGLVTPDWD